jgi:hypothetical protein
MFSTMDQSMGDTVLIFCNICGNETITIPDGDVSDFLSQPDIAVSCADFQDILTTEMVAERGCEIVQEGVKETCGCEANSFVPPF